MDHFENRKELAPGLLDARSEIAPPTPTENQPYLLNEVMPAAKLASRDELSLYIIPGDNFFVTAEVNQVKHGFLDLKTGSPIEFVPFKNSEFGDALISNHYFPVPALYIDCIEPAADGSIPPSTSIILKRSGEAYEIIFRYVSMKERSLLQPDNFSDTVFSGQSPAFDSTRMPLPSLN